MKKILFVSDLDGTLLRSEQKVSDYTIDVINKMTERGYLFSYATARSLLTAQKVTKGLEAKIPVIVYNGAFTMDNQNYEILDATYMPETILEVLEELMAHDIYPIVYAMIDGEEKYSVWETRASKAAMEFVHSRNDIRQRLVSSREELLRGNIFYITCIDDEKRLAPFYEKYKDEYHCVFQKDIYSGEQWLEFMPKAATKASAIDRLKQKLGCDYVIAFGDGLNDMEMFEHADEAYAVMNADPQLKAVATAVIGGNNEDGVAHYIEERISKLEEENG